MVFCDESLCRRVFKFLVGFAIQNTPPSQTIQVELKVDKQRENRLMAARYNVYKSLSLSDLQLAHGTHMLSFRISILVSKCAIQMSESSDHISDSADQTLQLSKWANLSLSAVRQLVKKVGYVLTIDRTVKQEILFTIKGKMGSVHSSQP